MHWAECWRAREAKSAVEEKIGEGAVVSWMGGWAGQCAGVSIVIDLVIIEGIHRGFELLDRKVERQGAEVRLPACSTT